MSSVCFLYRARRLKRACHYVLIQVVYYSMHNLPQNKQKYRFQRADREYGHRQELYLLSGDVCARLL
jgi:hypothetical protein